MFPLTRNQYIAQHNLPEMRSYDGFVSTPGSIGVVQKLAFVDEEFIRKLYDSIINEDYRCYLTQLKT